MISSIQLFSYEEFAWTSNIIILQTDRCDVLPSGIVKLYVRKK